MMDESGIRGDVVLRCDVEIGEVTASTAGYEDFGSVFLALFQDQDLPAPFGGLESAEKAGGPAAQDNDVVGFHAGRITAKVRPTNSYGFLNFASAETEPQPVSIEG